MNPLMQNAALKVDSTGFLRVYLSFMPKIRCLWLDYRKMMNMDVEQKNTDLVAKREGVK